MNKEIDGKLDKMIDDSDAPALGDDRPVVDTAASYRMLTEDKIAVSKKHGKLWKSRRDNAIAAMRDSGILDAWDEAIRYYKNDQSPRRTTGGETAENGVTRLTTKGAETENIVFANTTSLVPAIYAKNPTVEVTTEQPELQEWADVHERLLNTLLRTRDAPGVNLKPKMRRSVILATLTNLAWLEVGYTEKEDSSEQALADLNKLGEELANAKSQEEIREIEGKLEALEEKVDLLRPAGPWVKVRQPKDVLVDPDASTLDEARWVMIRDFLSTQYIRVVYGQKDEESEEWKSIYKPSHVLKLNSTEDASIDDELTSFSLINYSGDKSYKDYGYEDDNSYKRGQRTEVWYVWDKITRRVYLYNAADWTWPLWVWNDPYEFYDFFPLVPVEFYTDPTDLYAKGEVTYYLDQQDGINQINNEVAKVREFAVGKPIYNANVLTDEAAIDSFISGTANKRMLGVKVPPDVDLSKMIVPYVPQTAHMLETVIFDKRRLLESIDRVSSVTNVMRGVEYKTNTTNKAIESYESNTQTRLDEKIDAIEDAVGIIGMKIGHLCLHKMPQHTVVRLIGEEKAMLWEEGREQAKELGPSIFTTTVGGSSLKPTSATKKQQAIQVGQMLGQFAKASPAAIVVALKVMQSAFDEVVIRKEDWQFIMESIQSQMQKGGPGQGGGGEGGPSIEQVEQIVDHMPPEARAALGKMLAQGIPVRQAIAKIVQVMQTRQQTEGEPSSGEE